ncbi:cobyric acid synthase [Thalassobius vesicularis]|uniref:Cobyric acid synthase n=1 Tax=Thalassobius vesicularis TaxID=1294297 RepID=A0A4S3MCS7_9RHOB|nr:cobyric acid synthase [Thalassobius vesicularis]THD75880.1 cobyric acid synthase [Thalassobius vesicularis]
MARAIMIQGAGSNVGKSMFVAGLARALVRRGLSVRPFKPQNMSNNAAITSDGGEIGRAQALQARAAGVEPHTDMNPVLLKPETNTGAQVIVQGRRFGTQLARDFGQKKPSLMPYVLESFQRLCTQADIVLIEGAGSPAEVNLRKGDIANMGFAEAADVPVVLLGDIDRGGVIAQIVGTQTVLDAPDAARICAFAINKFRGDVSLFDDGLQFTVERTGWPTLGVLPWFNEAWKLPAEDVMDISSAGSGNLKIAVPHLSRISNFDDLDPLSAEPGVSVQIVPPGHPLPADAALVLLPGSKSTIADLEFFRAQGWDIDLQAHVRRGGHVLGICGGYQMLGREIHDPDGLEGPAGSVAGLGLLDVTTVMKPQKRLALTQATYLPSGDLVDGYEIHLGHTDGPDCQRAWLQVQDQPHGAASANGRVRGCYLHGLFSADGFRRAFLAELGLESRLSYDASVEDTLDALADHMEAHLDIDLLLSLAREPRYSSP